ncbi:MAG: hypothetical protein ACP6IP_02820 [Candidatus Njordarchaeia archaeon]
MDFFLPDKPIPESKEEQEVPLLQFRRLTGFIVIIMIAFSIISTSFVFSLGIIFDYRTVLYFFIPIVLFFQVSGIYFQVILIVELVIVILSLITVFTDREVGLIRDFDLESHKMVSFSEIFLIGYFLSIMLLFFFNPGEGVKVSAYELHRVALAAPVCEELSFRLIWLIVPSWIVYLLLQENEGSLRDSPGDSLLNIIIYGKRELNPYDWALITASAIFFGISHYISIVFVPKTMSLEIMFGWEPGKIVQAGVMGFFMGYLALKYGLGMSITFHWLINSFSIIGYVLYLTNNSSLVILFGLLVLLFVFAGFVSLIAVIYRFWKS